MIIFNEGEINLDLKLTYHDQDGWRGGHLVDLDHGKDLGHLSLTGAGVEESEESGIGYEEFPNDWS